MAPRLPRRTLQPADFKDPQRLQEIFNPVLESYVGLLAGGVSVDNLRQLTVMAKVTPPDEWVPLELLNGCTVFASGAWGVPAARWTHCGTEYRGILTKPTAGAGSVARIPDTYASLRIRGSSANFPVSASNLFHGLDVATSGTLGLSTPSAFSAGGFVSLWGVRHASSAAPPPWASPVDVTLQGANGQDYGTPVLVVVLGATRPDRVVCQPDFIPMWEAPLVGSGREQQRKLRLRRIGGLEAGVEHNVTLMCVYGG